MTAAEIRNAIICGRITPDTFDGIIQAMQHVRNVAAMGIRPGNIVKFNCKAATLTGIQGTILKVNRRTFKVQVTERGMDEIVTVPKDMVDKVE